MLDQEDRHVAVGQEAGEGLDRLRGLLDREPLGRLVEQQQARLLRQGHRDFEEPLVAMRQQAGRLVGNPAEAEPFERAVGPASGLRQCRGAATELPAPGFARLGGKPGILARAHLREEGGQLKGAGDAALADPRHREPGHRFAGKPHAALCRLDHPGDQVEQRRFAGAVGADDGAHLAFLDPHRHMVDRDEAAEAAGQLIEFEQRHDRVPLRARGGRTGPSRGPRCPPARRSRRR